MKENQKVQVFTKKAELVAEGVIVSLTSIGAYINHSKSDRQFHCEWFPFHSNELRMIKI